MTSLPFEYGGFCPPCGVEHRLSNDRERGLEALRGLFAELETEAFAAERAALDASPGKMIGVMVCKDGSVHRAYSGELGGRRDWPRWVPPVLRRSDTAEIEARTLELIARCEAEMAGLDLSGWEEKARSLPERAERAQAREALVRARKRLSELQVERREASLVFSTALFDAATLTNARGERRPLREVFAGEGIAGGTSDCTVPKLLEWANVQSLHPVALAEAWWGPERNGRKHAEPQAPCERKCLPILGYLLCGR